MFVLAPLALATLPNGGLRIPTELANSLCQQLLEAAILRDQRIISNNEIQALQMKLEIQNAKTEAEKAKVEQMRVVMQAAERGFPPQAFLGLIAQRPTFSTSVPSDPPPVYPTPLASTPASSYMAYPTSIFNHDVNTPTGTHTRVDAPFDMVSFAATSHIAPADSSWVEGSISTTYDQYDQSLSF